MKKTKIIKYIAITILVIIIGLISYVRFILPNAGKSEDIKIVLSPERIERGRYLANSVCVCMDCHSGRDWNKFSGPIIDNTFGQGGEEFNQEIGLPGKYFTKNITPFALKNWTDGEILRAISCGVTKSGKALFPIMPYLNYGKLDREDLYSIIAYIRTLTPISNQVPESKSDFPMNFLINTIPKKALYSKLPDRSDLVAFGSYLVTASSCNDCHTNQNKGKPIPGMEFAGGSEFPLPTGGIVRSANITPDKETGIGNWTDEAFIFRFKAYSDSTYKPNSINKGDFNTVMPWIMYSSMKPEDLKAIYAYLRTVTPVNNKVEKFTSMQN